MSGADRSPVSGQWRRLLARLSEADFSRTRLLIALDFDGTLSEIVATPDQAVLAEKTRRLLTLLIKRPDTKVAIISGRALDDVKSRVGLPGIYYAGNHGLEIDGPGIRWAHPRAARVGRSIRLDFEEDLRDFPGLMIEHKRLGFAVHYRGVHARHHESLRARMRARLLAFRKRFRVLHGKKTFDVRRDVPWDKGHALRAIRRALPGAWTAVFVGDDATDEEAFATIGPRALTVRIGRVKSSAAQYILPSRRLVDPLLERLSRRPAGGAPPEGRPR
ncbi:MAG: trehalose-phosphatase [Elusimicrobia bacterium]|nr:trehalose-phosphatase [Elusimicrobiota bacterium]